MTRKTYRPLPDTLGFSMNNGNATLSARSHICGGSIIQRTHYGFPDQGLLTEPLGAVLGFDEVNPTCILMPIEKDLYLMSRDQMHPGDPATIDPDQLSALDLLEYSLEGFYIGKSSIEGYGLFSQIRRSAGESLGVSHILLESGEWLRTPLGGFYNHPTDVHRDNCKSFMKPPTKYMRVAEEIWPHDEVVCEYTLYNPVP